MWTRAQFVKAMKAAGWEKQKGPGDGWRHKGTGSRFEGYNWDHRNDCENWIAWARVEQTPPPF